MLEGPPSAALLVITAQRGGTLRETITMAKTYAEARQQHGQSELLDEIVVAKPVVDHTRYQSAEELKEHSLAHWRDAVALLEARADDQELEDYKRFILSLANNVAGAHQERGQSEAVSDTEQEAVAASKDALGAPEA